MNFEIVNAKNLKMEFKKNAKIWHMAYGRDIKRLCEKDQDNKTKDSGGAYDIN